MSIKISRKSIKSTLITINNYSQYSCSPLITTNLNIFPVYSHPKSTTPRSPRLCGRRAALREGALALGGWGGGGRGQDLGLGWILMGIHGILRGIVMGI
jgi:hypothetical protein